MSTTVSNDTALLDEIERRVMEQWETLEVKFARIGIPGRQHNAWQVSIKASCSATDRKSGGMMLSGAPTLRGALEHMFIEEATWRLR